MSKSKPVILMFLENGGTPTEKELEFIKKGRAEGVVIAPRNRLHVDANHKPEPCDGVHAFDPEHIPEIYAEAPRIEEALKAYLQEREERRKLAGDEKAPEPPETKAPTGEKKAANTGEWKRNQ